MKSKTILLVTSYLLLVTILCGCDAFVRKFTRKPKKENVPQETLVVAPIEYPAPQISKEDLYRQYFLYWESWQNELIESLNRGTNHKKQVDCAVEAIKNLEALRPILKPEKQKQLVIYIAQLKNLQEMIAADVYSNSSASHQRAAEQIKRNIHKDISFQRVKDYLQ